MSSWRLPLGRGAYTALLRLALPLLLLRLAWRGRREPGYREHIAERLGRYSAPRLPARPDAGASTAAGEAGTRGRADVDGPAPGRSGRLPGEPARVPAPRDLAPLPPGNPGGAAPAQALQREGDGRYSPGAQDPSSAPREQAPLPARPDLAQAGQDADGPRPLPRAPDPAPAPAPRERAPIPAQPDLVQAGQDGGDPRVSTAGDAGSIPAPEAGRGRLAWLHAVSVGETHAARPLVEALLARGWRVLLTHMTPTGRATAAALFAERVQSVYLPWDTPGGADRFLDRFRPAFGAILETELWPNLIARCRARGVPLWLVNARLSERSAAGYRRLPRLTAEALAGLAGVLAQDEADAGRLRALGAPRVEVTGNLKFDVQPSGALIERGRGWRARWGRRPVWVAASTREGEEVEILTALAAVDPGALLVLVPRHPQRFDAVADAVGAAGLRIARRSAADGIDDAADPSVRVLLGDSMGEMAAWYAAADLAFVGGSLRPFGGQNLIEPCAIGCPVLVGPHTWNFLEAAAQAVEAGAAMRVPDAQALGQAVAALLTDPQRRAAMAAAGLRFTQAHRGATERTLRAILSETRAIETRG